MYINILKYLKHYIAHIKITYTIDTICVIHYILIYIYNTYTYTIYIYYVYDCTGCKFIISVYNCII